MQDERAHWLFDAYNITVNNLLSRQSFRDIFWKWSSIDKQLFDNVSANCFSIGYYFDPLRDHKTARLKFYDEIFSTLTVNTSCFSHANLVSNDNWYTIHNWSS